jgi:hypothetical protein
MQQLSPRPVQMNGQQLVDTAKMLVDSGKGLRLPAAAKTPPRWN